MTEQPPASRPEGSPKTAVRTVKVPGKAKRLGRWIGHTSPMKKAYIELAESLPGEQA